MGSLRPVIFGDVFRGFHDLSFCGEAVTLDRRFSLDPESPTLSWLQALISGGTHGRCADSRSQRLRLLYSQCSRRGF